MRTNLFSIALDLLPATLVAGSGDSAALGCRSSESVWRPHAIVGRRVCHVSCHAIAAAGSDCGAHDVWIDAAVHVEEGAVCCRGNVISRSALRLSIDPRAVGYLLFVRGFSRLSQSRLQQSRLSEGRVGDVQCAVCGVCWLCIADRLFAGEIWRAFFCVWPRCVRLLATTNTQLESSGVHPLVTPHSIIAQ